MAEKEERLENRSLWNSRIYRAWSWSFSVNNDLLFPSCQYSGTLVSSTNKPDRHDITEILLKVALNTIYQKPTILFQNKIKYEK